ncbi:MAG: hypothetical protein V1922_05650 [bacterium]
MSKYKVKEQVVNKMGELLYEVLGRESSKEKFVTVLNEVLSPVERLMVGKRLLIMYMIFVGIDYDLIIDVAKVSRATIAKYAFLLDGNMCIKHTFSATSSKDRLHNLINQLLSSVFEPGISMINWKSAWRLKRKTIEQKNQGF